MESFIFQSIIFILSILRVFCQYGHPLVGGVGEFSYECKQTETEVIQSPGTANNFEVIAGKPFSYKCEFIVDTRKCQNNPQSTGCSGIEIVWSIPQGLAKIEQEKGITRLTEDVVLESKDGFDKYRGWFNISDVGTIHDGEYKWYFNLKFEMRTVFEGSFRITTIDMIQNSESCKYDDSCQSNKCLDNKCLDPNQSNFPWMIVLLSIGGLVIIAILITVLVLFILRKKSSTNRRTTNDY